MYIADIHNQIYTYIDREGQGEGEGGLLTDL